MENVEPKSPFVTIIQAIVVGLILVFNAAMTAVFGWENLAAAFGGESIWAQFAGASYALLIFDLAAVVYLMVYRRNSFTQWQRHVALAMAVICLMGSISATIAQLANTAFGLSVLSEYKATVETVSLVVMISLTAIHAIVAATFSLMSNEGRMKDKAISTIATVSDKAFNAAVKQVKEEDHDVLVNTIAADIRAAILNELGFTKDLKQIGAAPGLPGKGTPTPTAQNNGRFYHLDQEFGGRLWFDTEKDARQSAAQLSAVWNDNVVVFREDGTKIAEYGGPSGGIDLMKVRDREVKQPTRPTPAPQPTRARANGVSHNEAGLNYPNGSTYSPE